eukprot:scaffold7392_cov88-Skeletonema_marinoi.AAC.1
MGVSELLLFDYSVGHGGYCFVAREMMTIASSTFYEIKTASFALRKDCQIARSPKRVNHIEVRYRGKRYYSDSY